MSEQPGKLDALLRLTLSVATAPPVKQPESTNAYVPWRIINALRAELELLGIDWKDLKKAQEEPAPRDDTAG
jgi:hypothetical protein